VKLLNLLILIDLLFEQVLLEINHDEAMSHGTGKNEPNMVLILLSILVIEFHEKLFHIICE